jgi:dienelactone hydrolase
MRNLTVTENAETALGDDDLPYRKLFSWEAEWYTDLYAVSLRDGKRRLLARKIPNDNVELSPNGRYVVAYDLNRRDWYALRTSDGRRSELTAGLHAAFYDERDDHPAPPPPYGFGGWVDGGKYALVLDRYDVWAVELSSGKASMLTGGAGRASHTRFNPLPYDADRDSYDSKRPLVLYAFGDDTKGSGLYVARFGPRAQRPRKVMMLPKFVANYQRARNGERYLVTEQRFDEVRNLWSAPSLASWPTRISDANPQQAHYLWGSAQLISYRSTFGAPLNGILLLPENFNPRKKHPMLVYFYERFSDWLYHPPFTIPTPGTSPTLVRYVSNGYVVLIPDVAYQVGHPGNSALGSVLPAIDEVVKRGFVDNSRVGIAGHSWAAYQIAYMITQTNRFRAAEAGAAVADMVSAYGGIRWDSGFVREFQYERTQSRIGATPWDRPDLYLENSALFHIKNIRTPYLTIANDADEEVPWYQGIEFITALRRLGKEAYMFEFDGESHNLHNRENQKYWTVHLDEFFDHFLKGAPEPDWMKNGVPYIHRGERDVRPLYGEKS